MEGKSRTEAALAAGMDRQTLRDWVHRYNEEGDRAPGRGVAVGPRLIRVDQAATPGSLMMGSLLMGARLSRLM
jgi:transposase-like protein